MQMGRIRAQVPGFFGDDESGWAMPCVPSGLSKAQGSALPEVDARNFPIWTGCWFGNAAETPAALKKKQG
jgi:hypothetical protein